MAIEGEFAEPERLPKIPDKVKTAPYGSADQFKEVNIRAIALKIQETLRPLLHDISQEVGYGIVLQDLALPDLDTMLKRLFERIMALNETEITLRRKKFEENVENLRKELGIEVDVEEKEKILLFGDSDPKIIKALVESQK